MLIVHESINHEVQNFLLLSCLLLNSILECYKDRYYTGLTLKQNKLVLLGDPEAFDIGLKTNGRARLTQLCTLLKNYFNSEDEEMLENTATNDTGASQTTIDDISRSANVDMNDNEHACLIQQKQI